MKKKNLVLNLLICFCMMFSTIILLTACKKDCVHTYADWVVTTDYTCTTDGVRTRTCTKCNNIETEIIPASHTLTHVDIVYADCANTGMLAHEHCSVCNKNFIDGVEKTDEQLTISASHTLTHVNVVHADCTNTGIFAHEHCSVCNKNFIDGVEKSEEQLIISAGDCYFYPVAEVEPTCTENGVRAHLNCRGCNTNVIKDVEYTDQELVIPATHNLVTIDAKAKTCYEDGHLAYTVCRSCNKVFINDEEKTLEDTIILHSHDIEHSELKNATCTSEGMLEHDYCNGCGKYYVNNVEKNYFDLIIPSVAHIYGDIIRETETVRAHYTCSVCSKNFNEGKEEISILEKIAGHTLEWVEKEVGTCESSGTVGYYKCTDDGCTDVFDDNYQKISNMSSGHPYDGYGYNENNHWKTCSNCTTTGTRYSHEFVNKYVCRDGVWYKYSKCSVCGYETSESTYDVPYKIEAVCPFIVGRHDLNATYGNDYNLKVYTYTRDPFYNRLNKMIPENSNFSTRLQELEQLVANGDTSSFPITETFTFKCEQYEQQVTITFDIERKSVQFTYPVYPKATESLGDFTVAFSSNFYDYLNECYQTNYVKLSDTTITDNDGFDINADCSDGHTYTIKFTYNEQDYEASFVYVSDKFVIQYIRSIATEICCGEDPEVDLRYANGSCSSGIFRKLKVIDGNFDKNTPGVYTVTFATIDGYAKPVTVTITVRDKKDVKEILDNVTYYMASGSNGFEVQVEYFDGTYGYEWIPLASIVEYEGDKLDGTKVGSYKVAAKIGDRSKKVNVNVYDATAKTITNLSSIIDGEQSLVWTKDNDNNIIYDLKGLYIRAEYNDGTEEILPITKEMISCTENGNNLIVEVTYKDQTCTFNAVIGDKTATGYALNFVFVGKDLAQYEYIYGSSNIKFIIMSQYGTGVLDGTYTLQLSNGSNVFFIDLDADMIYIDNEQVDLATMEIENYNSAYIMYNGEKIADIILIVYNKDDVFSQVRFSDDSTHLIVGSEAEIIEQLKNKNYEYLEKFDFDSCGVKVLYDKYLMFSDFTLGNMAEIDFYECGNVKIPIIYRNRTTYLDVQLIPYFDLYTSKSYTGQYDTEFLLYSNGYYQTTYAQYIAVGAYEFMNADKNIVLLHNYPSSYYEETVYLLNDDTKKISDLRMEGVEGFTKIGTFSDMHYTLFTMYENNGIYYGEVFGKYFDSTGSHIEYDCTIPINYDPVKERIYMRNAEYVIGEYDEENECFPIEIPVAGKTKYEYVDTEYGEKYAYNDNWIAYYSVFYNNAWHCISFWDWRYSEDKTQLYEYYEDLNEISCVIDISYLTKVD